jgi:hypothetical protein
VLAPLGPPTEPADVTASADDSATAMTERRRRTKRVVDQNVVMQVDVQQDLQQDFRHAMPYGAPPADLGEVA